MCYTCKLPFSLYDHKCKARKHKLRLKVYCKWKHTFTTANVIIHKQCFYEYTNKKISNHKLELSNKAKAGIKHERKAGIINLSGLIAMQFLRWHQRDNFWTSTNHQRNRNTSKGRHDIQYNDIQHRDNKHNGLNCETGHIGNSALWHLA